MSTSARGGVALALVVGLSLLVGGLTLDITGDGRQAMAAAIIAATIGIWASGAMPEHVGALGFFVAASLSAVAAPEVIFSGFSSTALWLVLGGLIIGLAVERTGLAAWLAGGLVGRVGSTYPRIVASIVAGATVLGFLVPSGMARAVILIPIVAGLADQIGLAPGRRGRTGLLVAAALSTYLVPATILPANLPNAVLLGAADTLYGVRLGYGAYLAAHFPVLGAMKAAVIVVVVSYLFHDRVAGSAARSDRTPLGRDARRCLVLLLGALGMWVTDAWHGVAPGWVSATAALVCLLPGVGLVSAESFHRDLSLGTVLYVAGVLGVGAVVADSGVGDLVAVGVLDTLALDPATPARSYAVLSGVATLLGTFATFPGTVAIMTPLAEQAAAQSGLPLVTVLMTIVVGYSTVLLPYQTAPLLFALKLGNVGFADSARPTLLVFAITVTVLLPLDYGWWRLLGLL